MEQKENDMERFGGMRSPRVWSGVIILIAGVLLLASKMGAGIPEWILTWPVLLIAIGLLTGIKSKFHNPGSFIMILVGIVFLIDKTNPELNFHNYILPIILICVGVIYILRPKQNWLAQKKRDWRSQDWHNSPGDNKTSFNNPVVTLDSQEFDPEIVEINAVFGSVKKIILSKNFKGGEINCFMGGAEINLMKADLRSPVALEINTVFGGSKLIVPSNWDVKNEVTAVFGGIEDKRNMNMSVPDPDKIIVLKGTCVFGGIEVTNY